MLLRAKETVLALLEPRRLVPILLVCGPLVFAQGKFSRDPWAVPLGVATCLAFVLVAPLAWRAHFPEDTRVDHAALRLLSYASIGTCVVGLFGVVVPRITGMGRTFLTETSSVAVSEALFLVGGWGLGRDIGLERSLSRERARAAALAKEAEQAQLLALRAHFDPHFLFNTLNAIAEWCREDGEIAERAILQLSSMLRTMLGGVRAPSWPLSTELELVRSLFDLHKVRDPAAFTLVWAVDETASTVLVPPMLLLPLAENAVKHGPAAGHRGEIAVKVRQTGDRVFFSIENPGAYSGPRPGSDGIPTVERRLRAAYEGGASFAISGVGERTLVTLSVPSHGPLAGVSV